MTDVDIVRGAELPEAAPEATRSMRGVGHRGWVMRRALLAADVVGLLFAFLLAETIVETTTSGASRLSIWGEVALFVACLPLWIMGAKLTGLYDQDEQDVAHSTTDEIWGVVAVITIGSWLFAIVAGVTRVAELHTSKLVVFWAAAIVAVIVARELARSWCRRRTSYVLRTVIVGRGEAANRLGVKLKRHPEFGLDLVGLVAVNGHETAPTLDFPTIGTEDVLLDVVDEFDVDTVIIASEYAIEPDIVRALVRHDVTVSVVPDSRSLVGPSSSAQTIEGVLLLSVPKPRLSRSTRWVKRVVDLLIAVPAVVLLSPFLLLIALAIKLDSRGPVLFRQARVGEGGTLFEVVKFRSMDADADARKDEVRHLNRHAAPGGDPRMFKIKDDPRVTRVGGFLRRTALDELPQVFNVLRGEMSIVGPRPLIPEEEAFVDEQATYRVQMRPGITGLWQISGASTISFDEMVQLDYAYVTGWSLKWDIEIILKTIPVVLFGRNEVA